MTFKGYINVRKLFKTENGHVESEFVIIDQSTSLSGHCVYKLGVGIAARISMDNIMPTT
jgi:hypothetical protein